MEGAASKCVKRQKGEFQVGIALKQQQHADVVLIRLTDIHRFNRFHLRISEDELQAQGPLFTSNIESVKDFYDYLVNQFDDLIITDDGVVIVQIEVTIKRKHQMRSYRFQGEKQEVNAYEILILQIQQLKNKFQEDSQSKDRRLTKLEESYGIQELKDEFKEQIKAMAAQKDNDASKARNQLVSLNERIQKLQKNFCLIQEIKVQTFAVIEEDQIEVKGNIEDIRKKIASSIENMTNINSIVIDLAKDIKSLKIAVEQIESRRREKWNQIKMISQNLKKGYFRVQEDFGAITVLRVGSETWQNYIGSQQLTYGKTHFFQMKQVKTESRCVIFGVGSKNAFGTIDAYLHKEILGYFSYSGNVFEQSDRRLGTYTVPDGSILSMRVDLKYFTVLWYVDGKEAATATIAPALRSTPLYLLLMMRNTGDEVQLLL